MKAFRKGLQNPYSSVRSRPAPPTLHHLNPSQIKGLSSHRYSYHCWASDAQNMPDLAPKWQRSGEDELKKWTEWWTAVHHPAARSYPNGQSYFRCIHPSARVAGIRREFLGPRLTFERAGLGPIQRGAVKAQQILGFRSLPLVLRRSLIGCLALRGGPGLRPREDWVVPILVVTLGFHEGIR